MVREAVAQRKAAVARARVDLESARRTIVGRLIQESGPEGCDAEAMDAFRQRCTEGLTRIHGLVDELKASEDLGLAALMVAVQAINDQCSKWGMEDRSGP